MAQHHGVMVAVALRQLADGYTIREVAANVVVCMDEKPVVLHQEIRPSLAMRPGCVARRDGEYQRCGTANVFCGVEPKAGRYFPKATANRSSPEFADYLLEVAVRYPEADTIHLVMDNLSSHTRKAVVERFGPEGGWLAVESVQRALHAQAWQLVESSRDRDQPFFAAMSGPTPDCRSGLSAKRNSGLEPSYESPSSSHPVGIYTQEGAKDLWLRNHAVIVLVHMSRTKNWVLVRTISVSDKRSPRALTDVLGQNLLTTYEPWRLTQ